ncbi:MAG TPA: hypothetical protein VHV75_06490 [Solirubrobacteraceae bacterium]|jgi:hypothetical protein|nr:hypothetical protein [Solirubrobacteraceae bacterium]
MTTKRRIIAGLAAALVLAASAGTASARQFNVNSNGSYVQVPPTRVDATRNALAPTIVHVTASGGGFDWADAGIGAGAGVAISALLLGGGLAFSQRRTGGHIRHA